LKDYQTVRNFSDAARSCELYFAPRLLTIRMYFVVPNLQHLDSLVTPSFLTLSDDPFKHPIHYLVNGDCSLLMQLPVLQILDDSSIRGFNQSGLQTSHLIALMTQAVHRRLKAASDSSSRH
jgi:hypothetical protein